MWDSTLAIMVPCGCTPNLDCGGCTMIFGSICASFKLGVIPTFGTMNGLNGSESLNCCNGGRLLKSIQGFAGADGV